MRLTLLSSCLAFALVGVQAQTPAPADPQPPAAPAAPPPSAWTKHGTDFSIWLDGYTDANFNHPDSGFNDLRNFDFRANNAHFSLGKLSIDHAPAGIRLLPAGDDA